LKKEKKIFVFFSLRISTFKRLDSIAAKHIPSSQPYQLSEYMEDLWAQI